MKLHQLRYFLTFIFLISARGLSADTCTFSVSPTDVTVDATPQTINFDVTRSSVLCPIQATASDFASVVYVPGTQAGLGPLTINVAQNTTGAARVTQATIAGQTVTIHQGITAPVFQDIASSSPYYGAANLLFSKKISYGCSTQPLLYCPDQPLTRGEMAVLLMRTIYRTTAFPYSASPYYTDVPIGHPYFAWVQKARDLGMITGCTPSTFCPDTVLTRGEAAVYLIRMRLGADDSFVFNPVPLFNDVGPSIPYYSWIQKLKELNITAGCAPNAYCPARAITRAEVGLLLARAGLNQFLPAGQPIIYSAVQYTDSGLKRPVLSIAGVSTNFYQGISQLQFVNSAIVPDSVSVSSMTRLQAVLPSLPVIPAAAGPVSIVAVTGGERATLPNAFEEVNPLNTAIIDNSAFLNPVINIDAGTTVEWVNLQEIGHDVTSNNGMFASGTLGLGEKFRATFLTPGTYPYHCSLHPEMTGTVIVK